MIASPTNTTATTNADLFREEAERTRRFAAAISGQNRNRPFEPDSDLIRRSHCWTRSGTDRSRLVFSAVTGTAASSSTDSERLSAHLGRRSADQIGFASGEAGWKVERIIDAAI